MDHCNQLYLSVQLVCQNAVYLEQFVRLFMVTEKNCFVTH